MNCIIIEDQKPAQRIIGKYLEDLPSFRLVGVFENAVAALDFLNQQTVDLIFLDINLPKISGISFLKNLSNPPQVIITSAYSEYALEGFELDVVDYLLKPFSFERFLKAISKLDQKSASQQTIFVKMDKEFFQLNLKDILYIKGDDDFTRVYGDEKMFLDSRTLKKWEHELPNYFMRIHKSYIINKNRITRIAGRRIFIDKQEIPIGRTYKEEVLRMVGSE
ncbi:MAG: LytTR family DNA-binding domain-containing protein [Bacteroidota bacterium]